MVKFLIKNQTKDKDIEKQDFIDQIVNKIVNFLNLNIDNNSLNQKQIRILKDMYGSSLDLYSFMQKIQNEERFNQNFKSVSFNVTDERNVSMIVEQKRFFQDTNYYNGFGIDFVLPNFLQNFNQLIIKNNFKPFADDFQLKSLDFNLQYFIPNGTSENKNNLSLFFINRFYPKNYNLKQRYSKLGVQIDRLNTNHQLYYKFKANSLQKVCQGNLIYQIKSNLFENMSYNLKFQIDNNLTFFRKILLTYNSFYREIDLAGHKLSIINFTHMGMCNYKSLIDQKKFMSFNRNTKDTDLGIQNNLNLTKSVQQDNFFLRAGIFNWVKIFRDFGSQQMKKSVDFGLNFGMRYGQNLFFNLYLNLLNDPSKKRFLFLVKFKNDVE